MKSDEDKLYVKLYPSMHLNFVGEKFFILILDGDTSYTKLVVHDKI
jgi:hypothetical protein